MDGHGLPSIVHRPFLTKNTMQDVLTWLWGRLPIKGRLRSAIVWWLSPKYVVGVSGLQKIIYQAVQRVAKRDIVLFTTRQDALDWLVRDQTSEQ